MKPTYFLIVAALIAICFSACKKDSSSQSDLIGKWNLQYVTSRVTTSNGSADSLTAYASNGDYLDFRSDGKVYSNKWLQLHLTSGNKIIADNIHSYDTTSYHLISNKLVSLDVLNTIDTIQINQLTSTQLVIEYNFRMMKDSLPAPNPNSFIIWDSKYYFSK